MYMYLSDYQPHDPKKHHPGIGIIGCGNIVFSHLKGYKLGKYRIIAMADIDEKVLQEKATLVPGVKTFTDYRELLALQEVEVVDCATRPLPRAQIIRDALNAGKHVLSQKPFVLDLKVGEELVKVAEKKKLLLAVNQNGRWNPIWNYAYQAIQARLIGEVLSVHMRCHWDHNGIVGTPFNKVKHIILYDYGIHWFDILRCWMDKEPKRVFASFAKAANQKANPPLLAQVIIEYENAQTTLVFDGSQSIGGEDAFFIGGSKGSIICTGPDLNQHMLEVRTKEGTFRPNLKGSWFPDGFHGSMGELLCAIEENREPWNNAKDNLESLQLCFAACASADKEESVCPSEITRLEID